MAVYIDAQLIRIYNARGAGREWISMDKVISWLREQGFWYWWTRNDLEPVGTADAEAEDSGESPPPIPTFIDPPFSPF